MKLDKGERVWFGTNLACWPIVIIGIMIMVSVNVLGGIAIWLPPFIALVVVMKRLMDGKWDD